jgi:hypothetical protein
MTGFKLPPGASGVSTIGPGSEVQEPENPQQNTDFYKVVSELPETLYKAATGEAAEVEFPDLPESTEIEDIGFFETIAPNLKLMAARDDASKAEIIRNSFRGDPRFGGVFTDKYDNPIVVWNKEPYYINKPGFSGQDLGTFIGEIAKYSPATKYTSAGRRIPSIAIRGGVTYPATELISQVGEAALSPEAAKSKQRTLADAAEDSAISGATGIAADIVVPGVVKPAARALKSGARAAGEQAKTIFPRYTAAIDELTPDPVVPPQTSKYPLTAAQREAQPPVHGPEERVTPALQEEDTIRRSPATEPEASSILRGFDQKQLDEIRADADALKNEFGSGSRAVQSSEDPIGAASEEIQSIASGRAGKLKAESSAAYRAVREAEVQPIFSREGIVQTSGDAINAVVAGELGITAREIAAMPILKRELDYLKRLRKMASNPRFKGQPLTAIHGYQKTINRAFRDADPGSSEKTALGQIKEVIDNSVFNGIEQGIVTGDQAILDQLKSATGLYRQYIGLTGKATGRNSQEKAANKILEMVTNTDYTPLQVSRAILGHAKFTPNQSMGLVIDKLKAALPENEAMQIVSLIKDGVLEKAFSGAGKSGVTRTNIVNNFDDVFIKQKAIISKLFSPEEISRIRQFKKDVLPTLWADIKLNPSGSGYIILAGLARTNLLNYVKMVPFIGKDIVEGAEALQATSRAKDAVRQYVARSNAPLFSAPITAAIRPQAISDDGDASAIFPLTSGMPEEVKRKVMDAVGR